MDTEAHVGQNATFTCDVGSAANAAWIVNGTWTRDLPTAVQNDVWICPLWTKLEYNMSRIQCVALSKSQPVESEVAHLIIG